MKTCYPYYRQLRREMDAWLKQSQQLDPLGKNRGGEDEANYALAWFPHYLVTGSAAVRAHFATLRDQLAAWVASDCLHGYERVAEAHHGTEPFLLFLPRFLGLFPDDPQAAAILADAAEHIGNWVPEIPAWYDYDRDAFRGYHLGTERVGEDPAYANELAEHFRFLHIALAAYRVTGEERYREWALRYGRRRAGQIAATPEGPLPLMWAPDGTPVYARDIDTEARRKTSAQSHHAAGDPLAGVEVLLASGAIYALGDLFGHTGEAVFRDAARRIAVPLVAELGRPYADPGAAAVGYYRRAFHDSALDEAIRGQIAAMPAEQPGDLALIAPERRERRWPGVGMRNDMLYWGVWNPEDGAVTPTREPSTAALTLAYQLTGDTAYARRAFRAAATKLMMARRILRGGREHADMGGAVCSVAAGHGRNWGIGAVTGCYGVLTLGTREVASAVQPEVEVRQADGTPGLPEAVLALVVPPVPGPGSVGLLNGGEAPVTFAWRPAGDAVWQDAALAPGEERVLTLAGRKTNLPS